MKTAAVAGAIEDYTGGYPFLVSRVCQLMDARFGSAKAGAAFGSDSTRAVWSRNGVDEAVKQLLSERNTLFESLTGKLENYPDLRRALRGILMEGKSLSYQPLQESIAQMEMYGFIRNQDGLVAIANRIFETLLYNLFLSDEELKDNVFSDTGSAAKNIFVNNGRLDMRLVMERFIETYTQVFGPLVEKFPEKDGRELFLLYLKPIINGTGNYYIEAQTRNRTRTDVVVDYLGVQYVIELKIWRGPRYNEAGERQLREYLDYFGLDTGYLLSFNFNQKKEPGVRRVEVDGKTLFEGVV